MHTTGGATDVVGAGGRERAGRSRHVGPYVLLTPLDDTRAKVPVPERRYIARSADGRHTVLLSLPLPGADAQRFLTEAEASRYLLGPRHRPRRSR
ncbi:hypothetical protein ABZX39_35400 [Streptomyces collinus]|uniref:hypothetical protein n=1 Tax=Streptomyces collinus TaxID=42684 RepID=UPI0033BCE890